MPGDTPRTPPDRDPRQQSLPLSWGRDLGDGVVGPPRAQKRAAPEGAGSATRPGPEPGATSPAAGADGGEVLSAAATGAEAPVAAAAAGPVAPPVSPEPAAPLAPPPPPAPSESPAARPPVSAVDEARAPVAAPRSPAPRRRSPVVPKVAAEDVPADPDTADTTMPHVSRLGDDDRPVGQLLMEARGERSLSIAQAAQKARVSREFIAAVEAGDLQSLPAPLYTQSSIRRLCREYGMAPEPVLEMLRRQMAAAETDSTRDRMLVASSSHGSTAKVVYQIRPVEEQDAQGGPKRPIRMVVAAALAAVVVLLLVCAVVQYVRNYRSSVISTSVGTPSPVDLGVLVTPQQIPLKELPVPQAPPAAVVPAVPAPPAPRTRPSR